MSKVFKNKINILFVICLVLFIIGCFYDYQISLGISNENNLYGRIIACIGQLPGFFVSSICLCSIKDKTKKKAIKYLCILLLVICSLIGGFYVYEYSTELSTYSIIVVALIIYLGSSLFTQKYIDLEAKDLIKICLIGIILFVGGNIIINIIKLIVTRPRMRLIMTHSEVPYMNWWEINKSLVSSITASGIPLEEFKSFPSGHTANAACIIWIMLLPYISKFKNENYLLIISSVVILLVAIGRIIARAHFLTDTMASVLIMILIFAILKKYVLKKEETHNV